MTEQQFQRFWEKVSFGRDCWCWTAATRGGYGRFSVGNGKLMDAHRFAYETLVGPIPEGLQIDHLCRVRNCVNPAHMEPVTRRENILRGMSPCAQHARKTHCKRGHDLSEEAYFEPDGHRRCRVCRNARRRKAA